MTLQTSPENPAPVRRISQAITQWVGRLGAVWVEGQVTQVTRRPGTRTAFLVLRDTAADISLSVSCAVQVLDDLVPPLTQGAHVVVHARPEFWATRGTLSLNADDIRPVGVGELLARLERLRVLLAAEGLFAADTKRPLPFLPRKVGLICGRASAAEKDVVENARRRWPAVEFRICEVAVQGPIAVTEVTEALQLLDRDPDVDVIVVTRGGGSTEDLLPFSNETLVRAVAACRTPVVSAIGHEVDTPLLDLVADVRASTPTDAAKRVVPDVVEELARVTQLRTRAGRAIDQRLDREAAALAGLRSRPAVADPDAALASRRSEVTEWQARVRRCVGTRLDRAGDDLAHIRARVRTLSPAATLERGYAVVQRASDNAVVRSSYDAPAGERLRLRLANGELSATAERSTGAATE